MADFLFGGVSVLGHLDVEGQILACQRMVRVQGYGGILDFGDSLVEVRRDRRIFSENTYDDSWLVSEFYLELVTNLYV